MAKDNRTKILEIKEELDNIDARISALKQLADKTDGRFQSVQEQNTEVLRLRTEIEALKNRADVFVANIEEKSTKATESEESIADLVSSAEESKEIFEEHSKNLRGIEDKIKMFEAEISEQLERAGAGALAVAFAGRQSVIEEELKRWRNHLYLATSILIVVAFGFLWHSFYTKINFEFFLKLTVVFPLIYAVWFSGKQYNKERFIVEQYAFKSAQAKSLAAFSKTVQEMEPEAGEAASNAQQFVIDSVSKIYIAPKLNSEDEDFPVVEITEKLADIVKEAAKLKG